MAESPAGQAFSCFQVESPQTMACSTGSLGLGLCAGQRRDVSRSGRCGRSGDRIGTPPAGMSWLLPSSPAFA